MDEEGRGRAAVGAVRQGVVVMARRELELQALLLDEVADAGSPEALLLQPLLGDQPAPERAGREDHGAGDKVHLFRVAHVVIMRIRHQNEVGARQRLLRDGAVGIAEPGTGDDDDAVRRGEAVELMAEPFQLDLARGGRGRRDLPLQLLGEGGRGEKEGKRKSDKAAAQHGGFPCLLPPTRRTKLP